MTAATYTSGSRLDARRRCLSRRPATEQVLQDRVRRFVQRLQMANLHPLVEHKVAELLEEPSRLASADDERLLALAVQADDFVQLQKGRRKPPILIARHADG